MGIYSIPLSNNCRKKNSRTKIYLPILLRVFIFVSSYDFIRSISNQGVWNKVFLSEAKKEIPPFLIKIIKKFPLCKPLNLSEAYSHWTCLIVVCKECCMYI